MSEITLWVGGTMVVVPIVGCYLWFWWMALTAAVKDDDPEGVLFMALVSFIVGGIIVLCAATS